MNFGSGSRNRRERRINRAGRFWQGVTLLLGMLAVALPAVVRAGVQPPAVQSPAVQPPAALPDLDVVTLSVTPRYPAYEVIIAEGVPLLLDPVTREPFPPTARDPIKRRPKSGEKLTVTARVVNHGRADSGSFDYTWLVNGNPVQRGRHPGLLARCTATAETVPWQLQGGALREAVLKPGTYADFTYELSFRGERQRVEFRVEPFLGAEDASSANNSRLERVDALAFVAVIRRREYNRWAELPAGNGTSSFEDWLQQQFTALRQKFEQSAYASAPGGVRQAIRLDQIRVLADDEPADFLRDGHAVNGWDGMLDYAPNRDPAADAGQIDWTLIRGIVRQMGVVDLTPLRVLPEANEALDPEYGLPGPIGFEPPPVLASEDTLFGEHTVLALNRQIGSRRGYRGVYLYDVPRSCRLRVLDNNSGTVAEAAISVYQAVDGRVPPEPIAVGTTNANGEWPLPNRPAPSVRTAVGPELRENVFGKIDLNGGNGLLLVRIAARGDVEYQWLPITLFNQAYWRGQTALATFDLRTRLPAPGAPPPPEEISVQQLEPVEEGDPTQVTLIWGPSPDPDVAAYFIYRGSYPDFQWERVGAVTDRHQSYTDLLLPLPGQVARFRYAVTAVNLQGNESALRRLAQEVRPVP